MKPLVKQTEKSRILSTRDYSLFEVPNRKVSNKFLNIVIDSITEKDLSPDYAILVDSGYKIIDGLYRFLALKQLQHKIYYKVAEVTTEADAIRAKHIHKDMSIDDIVKGYSDLPAYNQLLVFSEIYNLSLSSIVLSTRNAISSHSRVSKKVLATRKLQESDAETLHTTIKDTLSIMEYIESYGFNCTYEQAYDQISNKSDYILCLSEEDRSAYSKEEIDEATLLSSCTPLEVFKYHQESNLKIISKHIPEIIEYIKSPLYKDRYWGNTYMLRANPLWEVAISLMEDSKTTLETIFSDREYSLEEYPESRASTIVASIKFAEIMGFKIKPNKHILRAKEILHLN
jgi:hypothetical protein